MELSSHHHEQDEGIPMPINTSFIGVHAHHGHIQHGHITHHHLPHHHDLTSSSSHHNPHIIIPPSNTSNGGILEEHDIHHHEHHHHTHHLNDTNEHKSNGNNHDNNDNDDDDDDDDDDDANDDDDGKKKKKMIIRYKECQKNHAAKMGGNAKDGCGEFMPNGEEGTLESLICSVCNCHRNFHRKEIEGHHDDELHHHHHHNIIPPLSTTTPHSHFYPSTPYPHLLNNKGRKVILGSTPSGVGYPTGPIVPYSRSLTINMPPTTYTPSDQSDHHNHHQHGYDYNQVVKKRFRTKFSQEQKEKMMEFAEKVGWKIQKQEESAVQQFCQEIGVKRRVLKVWMHNNKHNLAKKNDNIIVDHNNVNNSS